MHMSFIKMNTKSKLIISILLLVGLFSLLPATHFCGVISKEEKTQSESLSSKSAERELIARQMDNQNVDYNIVWDIGNGALWLNDYKPVLKYTYGKGLATLPTKANIYRPGYTFAGWKVNNVSVNRISATRSGDIIIRAEWIAEKTSNSATEPIRAQGAIASNATGNGARAMLPATVKIDPPKIEESVATIKEPPAKAYAPASKKGITLYEAYMAPTAVSNYTYNSADTEPTAGARETRYVENDVSPRIVEEEKQSYREETEIGHVFKKAKITAKSEQKKFIYFASAKNETGESETASGDAGRIIGTQLDHGRTQLYDSLYDKKKVIAAGGGGGLGEGGGAKKQEDYGSGGTSMVITNDYSNMPAEVMVAHVTSDEPGNDLIKETMGKARDDGEFTESDTGSHAGKKIFEIDRNGDIGIDDSPVSIGDNRWLMLLGVFTTFIIGAVSYVLAMNGAYKRQEFF